MARGSDSGLTAWLEARGYELPVGAPSQAVLRQRATDYIDGLYGARLTEDPTVDPLLTVLENATYAAAWHEANNPGSLSVAATASGAVKREKVGPLEVEFFEGGGNAAANATVLLSVVEGMLAPFLRKREPFVMVV